MTDLEGPATLFAREPAHRVSPRAKAMWATSEFISGAIILAIVLVVLWQDWLPDPWGWILVVLGIVQLVGSVLIVPWWRYRVHLWEVTDEAVFTQRGWLVQERRVAPISRIQTVDTARGPLAQLFKLSSVTITTASAQGELRIDGLDRREADRLVHELTLIAGADGSDGT